MIKQREVGSVLSELGQPSNLYSDLPDLKLEESSFSNFIVRFSYIPTQLSEVLEIVPYLHPKLLHIASSYPIYKISFDINAIFTPFKIYAEDAEFILYSRRNSKYEANEWIY